MGKILVIRGGAIGDFILTLPAIRLLKEELPEAEIEIMGYQAIIALAEAGGYVSRTQSIEYGPMAAFFAPGSSLDSALCDYFASFDIVISYLYDPDHLFRDNLTKAGVETLIECSHRVDNHGAPAARQLAQPLESLALFLDDERAAPTLTLPVTIHNKAAAFLGNHGDHSQLIAVHPGSGSPYKNWDLDRWFEVITTLAESDPTRRFLIITGEAEDQAVTEFLGKLQQKSLPITPAASLPLPVLGAILSKCQLFLGHDSGVSHLAGAVNTPAIVLFGPTMSAVWKPQNPKVQTIEHSSGLLSEITVSQVIQATHELAS